MLSSPSRVSSSVCRTRQEGDIQVGTPKRGRTKMLNTSHAASTSRGMSHSIFYLLPSSRAAGPGATLLSRRRFGSATSFPSPGPDRTLTRGFTWSGCCNRWRGPDGCSLPAPARRRACAPSSTRTSRRRGPPYPLPRRGGRRRRSGGRTPRSDTRRWASLFPPFFNSWAKDTTPRLHRP